MHWILNANHYATLIAESGVTKYTSEDTQHGGVQFIMSAGPRETGSQQGP